MEKVVAIGGREVKLRTSARLPYEYREKFNADIIRDMERMANSKTADYCVIDRIAWLMARKGGEEMDFEEWLDSFEEPLAIFSASQEIMGLWTSGMKTTSTAKKK